MLFGCVVVNILIQLVSQRLTIHYFIRITEPALVMEQLVALEPSFCAHIHVYEHQYLVSLGLGAHICEMGRIMAVKAQVKDYMNHSV